jgi:hypothetical protein
MAQLPYRDSSEIQETKLVDMLVATEYRSSCQKKKKRTEKSLENINLRMTNSWEIWVSLSLVSLQNQQNLTRYHMVVFSVPFSLVPRRNILGMVLELHFMSHAIPKWLQQTVFSATIKRQALNHLQIL